MDGFRTNPQTVTEQTLLFTEIAAAAGRTPEATIPLSGLTSTSPPITLGTLLPMSSLIRTINYPDPLTTIPGNIAGGTGTIGTGSGGAGSGFAGCLPVACGSSVVEQAPARRK